MTGRTDLCREEEEEERIMDTIVGSNVEISSELVMVRGKDTSMKLEVKGQTEPARGRGVVVGGGHIIINRVLTQQKTNLFLDVRGKRNPGKMVCHQQKQEILELD
jgi:hypothetical protein